jgi:aminoglycoside phosphotransferase (APT) family kinase protein
MEQIVDLQIDRLGPYLESKISGFRGLLGITQFTAGNSNPTYHLHAQSGSYVLRRRPSGVLLPSAHAIDREFAILTALKETAIPVPLPLHFAEDESIIGSPFYVMKHVAGRSYDSPRMTELCRLERTLVCDEMGKVLANLCTLDYARIGLGALGKPEGYLRRQITRWTAQYRATETARIDAMEHLMAWLPRNMPEDEPRHCLVHGDFRLDNMLFDERSHRLTAVLDWELATIGPRYVDIAFQCMQWRLPAERKELRGLGGISRRALGIPNERRYVRRFCDRVGIEGIKHWNFYLALSFFRLAAICQGIYRRSLDGALPVDRAATFLEAPRCVAETARVVLG